MRGRRRIDRLVKMTSLSLVVVGGVTGDIRLIYSGVAAYVASLAWEFWARRSLDGDLDDGGE